MLQIPIISPNIQMKATGTESTQSSTLSPEIVTPASTNRKENKTRRINSIEHATSLRSCLACPSQDKPTLSGRIRLTSVSNRLAYDTIQRIRGAPARQHFKSALSRHASKLLWERLNQKYGLILIFHQRQERHDQGNTSFQGIPQGTTL